MALSSSSIERVYIPIQPNSFENLIDQIISNFSLTYCLKLSVHLNLPSLLSSPKTISQLAESTSTHPDSLSRFLRALSAIGFYKYDPATHLWYNNPYSSKLLTYLQYILLNNVNSFVKDSSILMHKLLESEKTILDLKSEPSGFFDEIYQDPNYKDIFQNSMNARTFMVTRYLDEHIDLRNYSAVIDIGGGNGSVLAFFMQKYLNMRGAVYDLPEMQELSENYISSLGLLERFSFISGDFFQSVPAQYDVHILKNILHDWNDEKCKIILRNIRNSLSSGLLLIIEYMVDNPDLSNSRGKRDDINMMVILNAGGRTELEYRALLNESGFEIKKITQIEDIMMVLQAIPI